MIYYVQYATNTLARFEAAPREGHMKRSIKIFCYLRYNDRGSIMFDIEDPETIKVKFKNNDWIDLYTYTEEVIPSNAYVPIDKSKITFSVMMGASHAL